MKFLILFACIAAASAVSFFPFKYGGDYKYVKDYPVYDEHYYGKYSKNYPVYGEHYFGKYTKDFPAYGEHYYGKYPSYGEHYGKYPSYGEHYGKYPSYGEHYGKYPVYGDEYYSKYGKDFTHGYGEHFDIGMVLGKDIAHVKKDFVLFYYKYLLEILDIFRTRFGDYLSHVDTFALDTFHLPMHCTKLNGMTRWMMTMNIDITKYDPHYFDYFMMCKMYDYLVFMKSYFRHFDFSIMYKDYGMIKDFYGLMGDHGYGLHKYYGDVFGHEFQHGDVYGHGIYGDKYYGLEHKY